MRLLSPFRCAPRELVVADAEALIASLGDGAYEEARKRAREQRIGQVIEANRPDGHWDRVRREIVRRIGRVTHVDTATRYLDF